jgi:type VI secretion system protein ImpL
VTKTGLREVVTRTYQQDVLKECVALVGNRYPFGTGSDLPVADFAQVFARGGVFDTYLRNELQPLIDTSRSSWTWREGASGGVPLSKFQDAETIRQIFFQGGGTMPDVRFTLTPESLSATTDRLVFELDGQKQLYEHSRIPNWPVKWPGDRAAIAALTFEDRDRGGGPNLQEKGPWAIFKLLERAEIKAESDTTYLLTFEAGGQQAKLRLTADSSRNPWGMKGWRQFRCG